MPLVVDAAVGEPDGRDAEHRARGQILVSARACGLALGGEAAPRVPASRGRVRARIAREHGEELHPRAARRPRVHRRPQRERSVVEMRRDDDHALAPLRRLEGLGHERTMIVALEGGEQEGVPRGWRRFVPARARRRLRPVRAAYVDRRRRRPLDLGDLRRTTPVDANWGFERGTPIDRVYVERFVGAHADDIRGRVLEIAAPDYTTRFGRAVTSVDVLMAEDGNPEATIVADLTDAPQIPDDAFDCAIVTQTLQFVYDVRAALHTLHRDPRAGGSAPRDRAGPDEDLPARGRGLRRVVALHGPLAASSRR